MQSREVTGFVGVGCIPIEVGARARRRKLQDLSEERITVAGPADLSQIKLVSAERGDFDLVFHIGREPDVFMRAGGAIPFVLSVVWISRHDLHVMPRAGTGNHV